MRYHLPWGGQIPCWTTTIGQRETINVNNHGAEVARRHLGFER